jgi:hypothetical protein
MIFGSNSVFFSCGDIKIIPAPILKGRRGRGDSTVPVGDALVKNQGSNQL